MSASCSAVLPVQARNPAFQSKFFIPMHSFTLIGRPCKEPIGFLCFSKYSFSSSVRAIERSGRSSVIQLVYCTIRTIQEGRLIERHTNLCATPARLRNAFVASTLFSFPTAREDRRSSGADFVISTFRGESTSLEIAVTSSGRCSKPSGIEGWTLEIVLSR